MNIKIKNNFLYINEFKLKCALGKGGIKKNKKEGDRCTPKGEFNLGNIYYRKDRVNKPKSILKAKIIKKNFGWCNDSKSKFYNSFIKFNKKTNFSFEKLFRKDFKYNYIIPIKYNYFKPLKNKGSAIFIHLTKKYDPTIGCVSVSKKDFIIVSKLINKNSKIKIS
tara:strand:- start:4473 stop:4967 length:495 start_codon:yes stop_codon:yes gene_type:complete